MEVRSDDFCLCTADGDAPGYALRRASDGRHVRVIAAPDQRKMFPVPKGVLSRVDIERTWDPGFRALPGMACDAYPERP